MRNIKYRVCDLTPDQIQKMRNVAGTDPTFSNPKPVDSQSNETLATLAEQVSQRIENPSFDHNRLNEPLAKENTEVKVDSSSFNRLLDLLGKVVESNELTRKEVQVDQLDLMRNLTSALGSGKSESLGLRNIEADQISEDDYLDKPAMFFAYKASTVIFDDVDKAGKGINMPYGKVKFTPLIRYNTGSGKTGKTVSMCSALVYSKKQAKFLRNHSLFNVEIFERIDGGKMVRDAEADRLLAAHNKVKSMNDHQVKQRAVSMNLPIETTSMSELRSIVKKAIAEEIKNQENKIAMSNLSSVVETEEGQGEIPQTVY